MKLNNTALFFLVFLLTACNSNNQGGGSSQGVGSSQKSVDIRALDIQEKARVNQKIVITAQAWLDQEDVETEVTKIEVLNAVEDCKVIGVKGMEVEVSSDSVGECLFQYTVEPVDDEKYIGNDTAISRVSFSKTADDNRLPNISKTTNIETSLSIDLEEELMDEVDFSLFSLSNEVYIDIGSGIATADTTNNTINYSPDSVGASRVLYSVSDGTTTKLGEINVAVSDSENTPPYAMNYQYDGMLAKGMVATIDLTDFVSDVEDAVILDSVSAYNAEVFITSANEHTFTFKSSEPGSHQVAYTITDGRGGFDVAQVEIVVEPDFSLVQEWDDIAVFDSTISADLTFTAPLSKVMADYTNTSYSQTVVQDGLTGPSGAEIVTMNLEQAQNYCAARGGRLPIRREWEVLLSSNGNLFQSHNWPGSNNLWSADMGSELEGIGFNIIDAGSTQSAKNAGVNVVSCVLLDSPAVKEFSTIIDYNAIETSNLKKQLSFKVIDPDGNRAPYQDIDAEIVDQKGIFSSRSSKVSLIANAQGEVSEEYNDRSFDNAVITTNVSATGEDTQVIPTASAETVIDTTNEDLWNIALVGGGYSEESFRRPDDNGLPILYKLNFEEEAAVYKGSFKGSTVITKHITHMRGCSASSLLYGKINLVIQQFSNQPNNKDWGYTNSYQEGIPHSNAVISSEINYYSKGFYLVMGNSYIGPSRLEIIEKETRKEYWYVWFVISEGKAKVYFSNRNYRPAEPTLEIEDPWQTIDPSRPFWVGFGADNQTGVASCVGYIERMWATAED